MYKIKMNEVIFPWQKVVEEKLLRSFPEVNEETLQLLLESIIEEFKTFDWNDKYRGETFYSILRHFYLHFSWKVNWNEVACLKKSCIQILYFLSYVGLILSNGDVESEWLNEILLFLKTFPGDPCMKCDVLLLIRKIRRKYHDAYAVVLRSILFDDNLIHPVDAESFVKILLLFRRLKSLSESDIEHADISSFTSKIKCPPDVISWLSSLSIESLCGIKQKKLTEKLLKKELKRDIVQKLFKVFFDNKYDERIINPLRLIPQRISSSNCGNESIDVSLIDTKGIHKIKQSKKLRKMKFHTQLQQLEAPATSIKNNIDWNSGAVSNKLLNQKIAQNYVQDLENSKMCLNKIKKKSEFSKSSKRKKNKKIALSQNKDSLYELDKELPPVINKTCTKQPYETKSSVSNNYLEDNSEAISNTRHKIVQDFNQDSSNPEICVNELLTPRKNKRHKKNVSHKLSEAALRVLHEESPNEPNKDSPTFNNNTHSEELAKTSPTQTNINLEQNPVGNKLLNKTIAQSGDQNSSIPKIFKNSECSTPRIKKCKKSSLSQNENSSHELVGKLSNELNKDSPTFNNKTHSEEQHKTIPTQTITQSDNQNSECSIPKIKRHKKKLLSQNKNVPHALAEESLNNESSTFNNNIDSEEQYETNPTQTNIDLEQNSVANKSFNKTIIRRDSQNSSISEIFKNRKFKNSEHSTPKIKKNRNLSHRLVKESSSEINKVSSTSNGIIHMKEHENAFANNNFEQNDNQDSINSEVCVKEMYKNYEMSYHSIPKIKKHKKKSLSQDDNFMIEKGSFLLSPDNTNIKTCNEKSSEFKKSISQKLGIPNFENQCVSTAVYKNCNKPAKIYEMVTSAPLTLNKKKCIGDDCEYFCNKSNKVLPTCELPSIKDIHINLQSDVSLVTSNVNDIKEKSTHLHDNNIQYDLPCHSSPQSYSAVNCKTKLNEINNNILTEGIVLDTLTGISCEKYNKNVCGNIPDRSLCSSLQNKKSDTGNKSQIYLNNIPKHSPPDTQLHSLLNSVSVMNEIEIGNIESSKCIPYMGERGVLPSTTQIANNELELYQNNGSPIKLQMNENIDISESQHCNAKEISGFCSQIINPMPCTTEPLVCDDKLFSSPESLYLKEQSHISAISLPIDISERSRSIYTSGDSLTFSDGDMSDVSANSDLNTLISPKQSITENQSHISKFKKSTKSKMRNKKRLSKAFISESSSDSSDEQNISIHTEPKVSSSLVHSSVNTPGDKSLKLHSETVHSPENLNCLVINSSISSPVHSINSKYLEATSPIKQIYYKQQQSNEIISESNSGTSDEQDILIHTMPKVSSSLTHSSINSPKNLNLNSSPINFNRLCPINSIDSRNSEAMSPTKKACEEQNVSKQSTSKMLDFSCPGKDKDQVSQNSSCANTKCEILVSHSSEACINNHSNLSPKNNVPTQNKTTPEKNISSCSSRNSSPELKRKSGCKRKYFVLESDSDASDNHFVKNNINVLSNSENSTNNLSPNIYSVKNCFQVSPASKNNCNTKDSTRRISSELCSNVLEPKECALKFDTDSSNNSMLSKSVSPKSISSSSSFDLKSNHDSSNDFSQKIDAKAFIHFSASEDSICVSESNSSLKDFIIDSDDQSISNDIQHSFTNKNTAENSLYSSQDSPSKLNLKSVHEVKYNKTILDSDSDISEESHVSKHSQRSLIKKTIKLCSSQDSPFKLKRKSVHKVNYKKIILDSDSDTSEDPHVSKNTWQSSRNKNIKLCSSRNSSLKLKKKSVHKFKFKKYVSESESDMCEDQHMLHSNQKSLSDKTVNSYLSEDSSPKQKNKHLHKLKTNKFGLETEDQHASNNTEKTLIDANIFKENSENMFPNISSECEMQQSNVFEKNNCSSPARYSKSTSPALGNMQKQAPCKLSYNKYFSDTDSSLSSDHNKIEEKSKNSDYSENNQNKLPGSLKPKSYKRKSLNGSKKSKKNMKHNIDFSCDDKVIKNNHMQDQLSVESSSDSDLPLSVIAKKIKSKSNVSNNSEQSPECLYSTEPYGKDLGKSLCREFSEEPDCRQNQENVIDNISNQLLASEQLREQPLNSQELITSVNKMCKIQISSDSEKNINDFIKEKEKLSQESLLVEHLSLIMEKLQVDPDSLIWEDCGKISFINTILDSSMEHNFVHKPPFLTEHSEPLLINRNDNLMQTHLSSVIPHSNLAKNGNTQKFDLTNLAKINNSFENTEHLNAKSNELHETFGIYNSSQLLNLSSELNNKGKYLLEQNNENLHDGNLSSNSKVFQSPGICDFRQLCNEYQKNDNNFDYQFYNFSSKVTAESGIKVNLAQNPNSEVFKKKLQHYSGNFLENQHHSDKLPCRELPSVSEENQAPSKNNTPKTNEKIVFVSDMLNKSCEIYVLPEEYSFQFLKKSNDHIQSETLHPSNTCTCNNSTLTSEVNSEESNTLINNGNNKLKGNVPPRYLFVNGNQMSTTSSYPFINLGKPVDEIIQMTKSIQKFSHESSNRMCEKAKQFEIEQGQQDSSLDSNSITVEKNHARKTMPKSRKSSLCKLKKITNTHKDHMTESILEKESSHTSSNKTCEEKQHGKGKGVMEKEEDSSLNSSSIKMKKSCAIKTVSKTTKSNLCKDKKPSHTGEEKNTLRYNLRSRKTPKSCGSCGACK